MKALKFFLFLSFLGSPHFAYLQNDESIELLLEKINQIIDARKKEQDKQRAERERERQRTQTENAPSLAVLKKKIKSGTKLGSTETASAKARGLIPRADGTKRKSDKYK